MIIVFGKTGQVARELQRLDNIVALGREEGDLTNPKKCADLIRKYAPRAVINAAAYTAVDKAEDDEVLATLINGDAPTAMAHACGELGIPFIHLSTDYVFDGNGNNPWRPCDKTDPQNAYGRSKLVGEIGVRNSRAIYVILRTSWVISSYGANFVKSMLRLSKTRNKVKVVADQIGGITPAHDIASACLIIAEQLISDSSKSGIFHFSGSPNASWAEFAVEIFKQTQKHIKVLPISTTDYPTPAIRPLNSRMECSTTELTFGIQRPCWKTGLITILKDLEVNL